LCGNWLFGSPFVHIFGFEHPKKEKKKREKKKEKWADLCVGSELFISLSFFLFFSFLFLGSSKPKI
jgi:hypothetical protein